MTEGAGAESQCIPGTFGEAVRAVADRLGDVGINTTRLDARLLVAHGAGAPPETALTHPERILDDTTRDRIAELLKRRVAREPMSHILGKREFWSMPLVVTPDTLTPRPDTECLVEAVLDSWWGQERGEPASVLDLGTGSGCILLAIVSEISGATGVGVDVSEAAIAVAQQNAERNELSGRVQFAAGDWFEPVEGPFDLIVSNPPYIETDEIAALEPEVADYEPLTALDGGPDGLEPYRRICADAVAYLAPSGIVGFEIGSTQAESVKALMLEAGLTNPRIIKDLAGLDRVVLATRVD